MTIANDRRHQEREDRTQAPATFRFPVTYPSPTYPRPDVMPRGSRPPLSPCLPRQTLLEIE